MLDIHDGNGPQPLAEGVEDLQVALGFDNNADGIITEVGAAGNDDEWTYNVVERSGSGEPGQLARGALHHRGQGHRRPSAACRPFCRPKAEDRPAGTVADGFFRRVIRTEVAVRNFNL